jgi:hypothetical protein
VNRTTSGAGALNLMVATEGTCEFLAEVKGHSDQFQRLLAVNDGLGQVALRRGSLPPGPDRPSKDLDIGVWPVYRQNLVRVGNAAIPLMPRIE